MIVLNPAVMEDLSFLVQANEELRHDEKSDQSMTRAELTRRMEDFLSSDMFDVFTASEGGEVVGYAVVNTARRPLLVRQLYVRRAYRRRGHGSAIMHSLMTIYNTRDLDVDVLAWNRTGIAFYEKLGFRVRALHMRLSSESQGDHPRT